MLLGTYLDSIRVHSVITFHLHCCQSAAASAVGCDYVPLGGAVELTISPTDSNIVVLSWLLSSSHTLPTEEATTGPSPLPPRPRPSLMTAPPTANHNSQRGPHQGISFWVASPRFVVEAHPPLLLGPTPNPLCYTEVFTLNPCSSSDKD